MADEFQPLIELILKWNRRVNITGLSRVQDIKRELIEDSLSPLKFGLIESPVLDAGCGGGFPTIPLAMKLPQVKFVSVDASRKKINFLREATRRLSLSNVEPVWGRLEEMEHLYGVFSTVLSKAFMPPERAIEFLKPFLHPRGRLIIYTTWRGASSEVLEKAKRFYKRVRLLPYQVGNKKRALLVAESAQ